MLVSNPILLTNGRMSEINAKLRSKTNSNASNNKKKLISSRPNIPFNEPRKSMETEFRPRKKLIPEKRKTVKLEMGSMRDENRYDAFRRNPRSMIRRLSRAASFKNASYSLDLQGILNQFEKLDAMQNALHESSVEDISLSKDNTWKEHICSDCVDQAGHCPMRFLNNSGNGYSNDFQNRAIHQYDKDNGVDGEKSEKERIQLSYRMDELILKCSFNQHDCDITSDFKLHNTAQYGNCYTFNWNRDSQITAHRAGANFGLRVLVYANVSEYLPTTEAIGFRITVHDKWTVPFVDAFGENAPTGMLSSYGVRMKKFFRLEHPYGHCRTGISAYILRICGCADPTLPIPSGSRQCGMEEQKARECIRTIQDQKVVVEERLDKCKCPLPCHEIGYELTYSAARWPSGTARIMECASSDELCLEQYRINAVSRYNTYTKDPTIKLLLN
uniref:Amiloride-sensitive sodium channel n=1 Tax=Meloidogyne javanica TaxID=6303 RepID=A0A915LDY3_MELJA